MQAFFQRFERLVEPFPEGAPQPAPTQLLRFFRHSVRGLEAPLLAMTLLSTLMAAIEVSLFGFTGKLVDSLAASSPQTFLSAQWPMLLFFAALVLLALPLTVFFRSTLVHQTLMGNFAMRVRWQAHRYLLEQSLAFFQDQLAGGVATKLMQTSLAVRESVMKVGDIIVYVGVYFLSMVVLVASADWRLMLPLAVWLLLYVLVLRRLLPKLRKVSEQQAGARSVMTGRVTDTYSHISTVKLFSQGERESRYAREGMQGFLDTVYPQMRLVTMLSVSVWTLGAALIFAVSALSIFLWMQQAVSPGAIAVAIGLCLRLNGMSQWIMWEVSSLSENIGTVRDGINTLSREVQVVDKPGATALRVLRGDICMRDLHFAYDDQQPVFQSLNLHIRAGEKVGLVGRSGAGKSSLVSLLLRFYDVQGGEILIDDQALTDVTQESLRASIGMVTQDTSLMHRSIRDNIAYGRPDATEEQIIGAAKRAQAWEFIRAVRDPEGRCALDAHVGDRGVRLSGGQRQRIAIARVLLKDAPILVLDEATSALDSEVEAAIQGTLGELMEGKTVIAIAHRLSTIAAMDRLLVMEQGRVVEQGSHRELVDAGGIYSRLWAHQSGGFLGEEASAQEHDSSSGYAA
ncbi:MAG: ABC transporter ATP-binding protein [Pseudomonadota bacterium]